MRDRMIKADAATGIAALPAYAIPAITQISIILDLYSNLVQATSGSRPRLPH